MVMAFGQAIAIYFKKFVTFLGRAMCSEYWYFVLFNLSSQKRPHSSLALMKA
jgi:uncharacterized membrane protein YhaH (DUF805 family)